jgi:hypothetical protein
MTKWNGGVIYKLLVLTLNYVKGGGFIQSVISFAQNSGYMGSVC